MQWGGIPRMPNKDANRAAQRGFFLPGHKKVCVLKWAFDKS